MKTAPSDAPQPNPADAPIEFQFAVGDVVHIKGQRVNMTVEASFDAAPPGQAPSAYAAVVWFVEDQLQRAQFPEAILLKGFA